jgi:NAD(P)-dependent dehydrogenase (short-subunit alcohol dehydrogenase family)
MLAAITGHTSGIGRACWQRWGGLGFSRSNGYDVNQPEHIVRAASDADLFINCAHGGWGQSMMLQAIFDAWRHQPRHIFNIGVDKVGAASWELVHVSYPVQVLATHALCEQLQSLPRQVRVTNVCLAHVENWQGDIAYDDICDAIDLCYNKQYEITRISIGNGHRR